MQESHAASLEAERRGASEAASALRAQSEAARSEADAALARERALGQALGPLKARVLATLHHRATATAQQQQQQQQQPEVMGPEAWPPWAAGPQGLAAAEAALASDAAADVVSGFEVRGRLGSTASCLMRGRP
jgi:hypothetical protein